MRTAIAMVILIGATLTAVADSGPVIAIPSRPDVPVLINGRDASYAVVEGDWGLARDIHVEPTVYYGWGGYHAPPPAHYYPSFGRAPGYGRREIETAPRHLPRSESFYRSWSAESNPMTQLETIPLNPPPIIVAPRDRDAVRWPRPRPERGGK